PLFSLKYGIQVESGPANTKGQPLLRQWLWRANHPLVLSQVVVEPAPVFTIQLAERIGSSTLDGLNSATYTTTPVVRFRYDLEVRRQRRIVYLEHFHLYSEEGIAIDCVCVEPVNC